MKSLFKIFLAISLWSIPLISSAQIAELKKYADSKNTLYVYVSETMIRMAEKYGKQENMANFYDVMMSKLTSIQKIIALNDPTGKRLIDDVKSIAQNEKYELLISIDNPDSKSIVYFKPGKTRKEKSSVLLIKTKDNETTVAGLQGYFDADDIGKLIN